MIYLFFDTETTRLPNNKPFNHPEQARLLQFAAILANDRTVMRRCCFLIHPENFIIQQEAMAVHGITTEKAKANGIPLSMAVDIWHGLVATADIMVAHNISFDLKIMKLAEAQVNIEHQPIKIPTVCTMREANNIVRLPSKRSNNSFKNPKLEECVRFFFNEPLNGAHDALEDTNACMRVYYEILDRTAA